MAKNTTIRPRGYMTPNEVGELLGRTGDCIKGWIRKGKLKARRTPNRFYWIKMSDALKAFIAIEGKTPSAMVHIEEYPGARRK